MKSELVREFIRFFTSLKLTVVLLTLSIILVFLATLDQVTLGIWAVQEKWFRSFIVIHFVKGVPVPVFPGGYFIGGLLLVNLVVTHLYRFRLSWKKAGIHITHGGLILLLVGELITGIFQREYQMRMDEGETKNFSESPREVELAIVDITPEDHDHAIVVPSARVARGMQRNALQHPELPFTVRTLYYYPNSSLGLLTQNPDMRPSGANRDIGARLGVANRPLTFKENERNLPAALLELRGPDGPLGTWLVSPWLVEMQTFDYGGRTWRIGMRFVREYKPYTLTLEEFTHDRYPGTDIPKNFSSRVILDDPREGGGREILIFMNNPLRHGGYTFYQAGFDNDDTTTILQVVTNPGWLIPYISCLLLTLGLGIQFGIHLFGFARRQRDKAEAAAAT